MGQRAFRGRLTDSLIKNYLHNGTENSLIADDSTSAGNSGTVHMDDSFFQGKLVDLNLEFNIENPLQDLLDINIALTKGVINATIPKGTKIKNLNLVIKSSLFGEGKTQLYANLYVLFGSHFYRDIRNINIKLFNPVTKRVFNDRKTISNILDFMCFKTIKLVRINNALLYYVIPEYSEFAIVLAYKDINIYEKHEFNLIASLEDLLFHPYCTFERKVENFMRCLNAIERTVPKEVNNIILPIIYFNNLSSDVFSCKSKMIFSDLHEFVNEILMRFKIMSLELKVNFKPEEITDKQNHKSEENYFIQFIQKIIEENFELISQFTYSYISFDFVSSEFDNFNSKYPNRNSRILEEFRKILFHKKLTNVALANHITYKLRNSLTNLEDSFDFYDYIYYDKSYADQILNLTFLFKKHKVLSHLYKKKVILQNVLKNAFDFSKVYSEGRLNFSTEIVKNKKIVPFEVAQNKVMVFTN